MADIYEARVNGQHIRVTEGVWKAGKTFQIIENGAVTATTRNERKVLQFVAKCEQARRPRG